MTTTDAPVTVEQKQLWCMHVLGPDDVHPAPDRATAQLWAAQWTVYWHRQHPVPRLHDPVMSWIVAEWPHDAASHADGLAKSIADNTWPVDPLAALASAPAGKLDRDHTARRIKELVDEGDGFWTACSGCQEGVDGYVSEKDYPFDPLFRCQPGGGCSECGGIGVLWDDGRGYEDITGNEEPASAPAGDGVEEADAVALLRRVAVNARFDWLGRDDCSAVRAALARPRAAVGEREA